MRPWHERFLAAVAAERRRLGATRGMLRRGFLGSGVRLAGGGALALVVAGGGASRARALTAQEEFAGDADVLNYALALEHLEAAFYREGLETFDEAAFAEAGLPRALRPNLEAIRDHEEAHVSALTQAIADLGGTPDEPADYDFGYDDLDGFFEVAAALENTGVAAYAWAAPFIEDRDLLATALGIHSVEARHAAYLNPRTGASPFPDAVDQPLGRDEVRAIADEFVGTVSAPSGTIPVPPAETPPSVPELPREEPIEEPPGEPPIGPPGGGPPATIEGPYGGVVADAAARLWVPADQLTLVMVEPRQWPDSSLGCPKPGEFYAQVITPGYLVVVAGAGRELEYHTDEAGNFVLCE